MRDLFYFIFSQVLSLFVYKVGTYFGFAIYIIVIENQFTEDPAVLGVIAGILALGVVALGYIAGFNIIKMSDKRELYIGYNIMAIIIYGTKIYTIIYQLGVTEYTCGVSVALLVACCCGLGMALTLKPKQG